MRRTTTIVIGAGQCGLAVSHHLAALSVDHVVLERGEVGNSWATERWDSLRLLTPNWMCRLPGFAYDGDDPDGYMGMDGVVDFLAAYAAQMSAPVETNTAVLSVGATDGGYEVVTDRDTWRCRAVVVATGACNVPSLPKAAEAIAGPVAQMTPFQYRNPDGLADGGVLVVGASATGVQLAREIRNSGRRVILAVGEHVRLPRTWRGRDIKWWMDAAGVLDTGLAEVDDPVRARGVPSPQLAGTEARADFDLNALTSEGVEITGRVAAIRDGSILFSGGLRNVCALADLKMNRLLELIDAWSAGHGMAVAPAERPAPTRVPDDPRLELDLHAEGIRTVLWATGFRPDHSWLEVPVFDRKGRIRHEGGVVPAPGLYVMGLPFLRKRKSTLIDGAGDDAAAVTAHMRSYLEGTALAA
jgi:putative flavoprotein involved in K+ transport